MSGLPRHTASTAGTEMGAGQALTKQHTQHYVQKRMHTKNVQNTYTTLRKEKGAEQAHTKQHAQLYT